MSARLETSEQLLYYVDQSLGMLQRRSDQLSLLCFALAAAVFGILYDVLSTTNAAVWSRLLLTGLALLSLVLCALVILAGGKDDRNGPIDPNAVVSRARSAGVGAVSIAVDHLIVLLGEHARLRHRLGRQLVISMLAIFTSLATATVAIVLTLV